MTSYPLFARWLRELKHSLTAQISLSIAFVATVLVAGSGLLFNQLATRELREGSELIMFANLAMLREDLALAHFDLTSVPQRLVQRMELQFGQLDVALLDEQRNVIAQSEYFEVPVRELPAQPIPVDTVPQGVEQADVRALGKALGPLTTVWTAPDKRRFRVLFARIPIPPDSLAGPNTHALLVAFAYEQSQTRQVAVNVLQILVVTLLVGVFVSTIAGFAIARRIVAGPIRLGAAANRISERPMSERLSLAETPTELVETTEAFNRMLDRLEASFRRLTEFSADLAHDLRTPINNLLGEAQVALSKPRSADEYRTVLESAVEDYERISRLIENMLFLARADNPQGAILTQWIALGPVLERANGYFELLAEDRGVAIAIEQEADAPAVRHRVWADETLLMRALGNLVANALRYAPRGSTVSITTHSHGDGACTLHVANQGEPIAPEHQALIFERSFRVDESRAGSAIGSGLGLAIVKSVMELHDGSVSVSSGPGEATVFTLRFPAPPPSPQPFPASGRGT